MSRPAAPSFPTPKQISDTNETVAKLYPDARIARVGPNGVEFWYPSMAIPSGDNSPDAELAKWQAAQNG